MAITTLCRRAARLECALGTGAEYQVVMRDALARKFGELLRNPEALRRFMTKMERDHPLLAQKLVRDEPLCGQVHCSVLRG